MTFNNKLYNILKWIAMIALPALATLVMALGDIWKIPCKEEISLTITAVDAFLGVLIGVSTASYKGEGKIEIEPGTDTCIITFNDENTLEKAQKTGKILLTVGTIEETDPAANE